jgi:predicted PurR-regulated permease PerM
VRLERQIGFWIAALVVFLGFLLVFRQILLPFVAGMALAYALDPVADWFERRGFGRLAATLAILILFVVVFILVLMLVGPILANQLADFIDRIPSYVEKLQGLFATFIDSRWSRFLGVDSTTIHSSLGGLMSQGAAWLTTHLGSLWTGGRALLDILSLFIVTPVVAFYLLYDWDRMVARVDGLLPLDHREEIRRLARDIDRAIAAFVRGQGLLCLILGIFYASGLVLVGLNFGFLIGIAAGLLSFIPYVGFSLGFIVSLGIALVQFAPDWFWVGATVLVFVIGQALEGYVLQPRLIGHSVGLHPVWLLFALFAFGLLFGFVGLMIAIPAAAAIGVLARYGIERYRKSEIYTGTGEAKARKRPPRAS